MGKTDKASYKLTTKDFYKPIAVAVFIILWMGGSFSTLTDGFSDAINQINESGQKEHDKQMKIDNSGTMRYYGSNGELDIKDHAVTIIDCESGVITSKGRSFMGRYYNSDIISQEDLKRVCGDTDD